MKKQILYQVAEIAPQVYAINECGLSAMYLIAGSKRALLIDAGVGIIPIREIIKELTPLPCDLVLTHGHQDHVGAAWQFPQVYLHEKDWPLLEQFNLEDLKSFVREIGDKGAGDVYGFHPEDINYHPCRSTLLPIREGQKFELGGRTVEVLEVPGHTPGSCCFFDDKSHILFSGDACNTNLLLFFGCPVSEALKGLEHLRTVQLQYLSNHTDISSIQNYSGHIGYGTSMRIIPLPDRTLTDCITGCQMALEGKKEVRRKELLPRHGIVETITYGTAKISFKETPNAAQAKYFSAEYLTKQVIRICGTINEYMYLVMGEKRALLIDTGCGTGDLKEYISALTDLPVTVVLTHGHSDHTGGCLPFDDIYIGKGEVVCEIPNKYHPLTDGMIFDLGKQTAEAILCPGHTRECFAILLKEERMLLTGDAAHHITYLFFENSLSVEEYMTTLKNLKKRESEWDLLLLSHPIGQAPKSMLDDLIEVCEDILTHKDEKIPFTHRGISAFIARPTDNNMRRTDGKYGNIIYNRRFRNQE